jgi:CRP-like cAMP-binding protein
MHLILGGTVRLSTDDGRQIAILSSGQCLGETVLLTLGETSSHSMMATAQNQVETAAFTRTQFSELIRRRPDIGVIIYRNLATDVSNKLREAARSM